MNRKSNMTIVVGALVAALGAMLFFVRPHGAGADSKPSTPPAGAAEAKAQTGGLDIPAGLNAVSFSMPVPQAVARYVTPQALINVFATYKGTAVGPEATATTTKLILSNALVLSNRAMDESADKATPVTGAGEVLLTLALRPDDAEKMIYARENGTLWFTLVRPGDPPANTSGRTPKSALR